MIENVVSPIIVIKFATTVPNPTLLQELAAKTIKVPPQAGTVGGF
tara:strand:- start:581 stop:715 length:135 start_codon:yes stop_codon:yes gene_type:complete